MRSHRTTLQGKSTVHRIYRLHFKLFSQSPSTGPNKECPCQANCSSLYLNYPCRPIVNFVFSSGDLILGRLVAKIFFGTFGEGGGTDS